MLKSLKPSFLYRPDRIDPKNDTLKIDLTVVVKHKDGEATSEPLKKTIIINTSNVKTNKDLGEVIEQAVLEEMKKSARAQCLKKGCNE